MLLRLIYPCTLSLCFPKALRASSFVRVACYGPHRYYHVDIYKTCNSSTSWCGTWPLVPAILRIGTPRQHSTMAALLSSKSVNAIARSRGGAGAVAPMVPIRPCLRAAQHAKVRRSDCRKDAGPIGTASAPFLRCVPHRQADDACQPHR